MRLVNNQDDSHIAEAEAAASNANADEIISV